MRILFRTIGLFAVVFSAMGFSRIAISEEEMPVCGASTPASDHEHIFEIGGKKFGAKDLTIGFRQTIYESELKQFEQLKGIIDAAVIDLHMTAEAKKVGRSREELEKILFPVKEPTEKEVKAWYDSNKARIPYPLDKIKNEIKKIIKNEKMQNQKIALLEKIKKKGKFNLLIGAPEAPLAKIATKGYPTKGNKNAKVKIIEFADYQCGHCKIAAKNLKKVVDKYKNKVQFTYMDFPLRDQGASWKHAVASHCAGKQGKFWEYHYKTFEQSRLSDDTVKTIAKAVNLDQKKFDACLKSKKTESLVKKSKQEGERIGINGTPSVYINGRKMMGYDIDMLEREIKAHL